jgi:gluconate 2-dehydrogenase
MKPKVLVTREVFPEIIESLSQHFDVETNPTDEVYGGDELVRRLQGKDGLFANPADRISRELIAAVPQLKAVCNMAVGYNNIDVPAATEAGILVTNTPDVLNETTADHAWALLLAAARRVTESEHWLRAGQWKQWRYDDFLGTDIHGATLGIIGMGRIGQAIARRSIGFGMKVVYHNRSRLTPEQEAAANGALYLDKEALLRSADHIVLVLPYSPTTHHTIGANELALMKPTAVLVNIARGGIVDDAALIDALKRNRIAAAGLDVFENEPTFNPALLELTNVVLTPHIGSSSRPTRMAMAATAANNLITALTGRVPPNLLNPDVLKSRA